MKSKQFVFAALAILWIFFIIVDRAASAIGGIDLLKNRKPLALSARPYGAVKVFRSFYSSLPM